MMMSWGVMFLSFLGVGFVCCCLCRSDRLMNWFVLCDGHEFSIFVWDWECPKMGCWRLFSRDLAMRKPIALKRVMLECIDPWQPIIFID